MQAQVSVRRLCRYLCCPETDSNWTSRVFGAADEEDFISSSSDLPNSNKIIYCGDHAQRPHVNVHGEAIMVKDAAFTWSNERDASVTLDDVSLSIPEGSLVVVLGKVPHYTALLAILSI